MVEHILFALLVSGYVGLALTALANRPILRLHYIFAGVMLSTIVWAVVVYLQLLPSTEHVYILGRIDYASAAVLLVGFYYFCVELSQVKWRRLNQAVVVLGASVAALALTGQVVDTKRIDGKIVQDPEWGFAALATLLLVALIGGAGAIYWGWHHSKGKRKAQLQYVGTGLMITAATLVLTNVVLPRLFAVSGSAVTLLGLYSIAIFGIAAVIALVKHRFLDIKLFAVRTTTYILALLMLSVLYFLLAFIGSLTLSGSRVSLDPTNVVLALIIGFMFQPIRGFFDRSSDVLFFRNRYDAEAFVGRIGDLLTSSTQLHQLLATTAEEIAMTLKASYALFIIDRDHGGKISEGYGRYPRIQPEDYGLLRNAFDMTGSTVIVVSDIHEPDNNQRAAIKILHRHNVAMIVVLDGIGSLLIGEHKASGFTSRDVRTLENISDELVIAVQNARSVQEVEDLNKNLQARIDQATKDLRTSNEKLKRLDATKDEFISMASHQLRTPLTSVKGYLSMVLEGDAGKLNDQQRHLLSEAYTSSERMVHLVGDFLNVSRVQTGKFVVDAKPTNLASVIADEVSAIERMAEAHGVSLIYHPPKKFPLLNVDEDKLRQVVMNFVDNAIYYSRDNSAIVIKVHATHDEAIVEVHDHGIGVPKAAQDRLFTKFFRADNARRQRPDGTGVGLFLAKKVVTAHGGEIIFQSTEGRGSVFGFRLPISKLKVKQ